MKIAVLFGGTSTERDVSVASGSQVIGVLRRAGHEVIAVEASRGVLLPEDEHQVLSEHIDDQPPAEPQAFESKLPAIVANASLKKLDLIFLAMHGGIGEDGTIQGLLELAGIPYTGSDALGSALAMDKDVAKRLFLAAGVPTPAWLMAPATLEEIEQRIGFPVIVKPNGQGSTLGLSLVTEPAMLVDAIDLAAGYGGQVMLEQYIPGRELTVGILDDAALAVGEIIPATGKIFDYTAKYQTDAAQEIFPADLNKTDTERVQEFALMVHRALKLASYSRADFRLDPDGGLWCLEVNTLPGLTAGSLLPKSAAAVGISFAELCERICSGGLSR
ncbi:MAG: D-alanine--D-alanine ligase [Gammaproteobacteria bacterium]|nr:D-alanine--D-alanine ligase [Gammaproteobacteria bacterium]